MVDAFLPDAESLYLQFCAEDGDFGVEELALALQCLGTSALDDEQLATMLAQLDVDGKTAAQEACLPSLHLRPCLQEMAWSLKATL